MEAASHFYRLSTLGAIEQNKFGVSSHFLYEFLFSYTIYLLGLWNLSNPFTLYPKQMESHFYKSNKRKWLWRYFTWIGLHTEVPFC